MAFHTLAVGGLIRDRSGKVLLVKSPLRGWEFPGGMVERAESPLVALMREIREESVEVGWFSPQEAVRMVTNDK